MITQIDDYGAELLAIAIISQACQDHQQAAALLKKKEKITANYIQNKRFRPWARNIGKRRNGGAPVDTEEVEKEKTVKNAERQYYRLLRAQDMYTECERFLRSEFFSTISGIDGEVIIEKLREKEGK